MGRLSNKWLKQGDGTLWPIHGGSDPPPEDNPDPAVPAIEVDGRQYSQEDVQDLINGNMMQADYTKGKMALSRDQEALARERAQFAAERAVPQPAEPKAADLEEEYQDPELKAVTQSVKELTDVVKGREARDQKRAEEDRLAHMNSQIDLAVDRADELIKSDYKLATLNGVAAQIQNHIYRDGKVPTAAQVQDIVIAQHREVANRGGSVREHVGDTSQGESTKEGAGVGDSPPSEKPPARPNIDDSDEVEKHLAAFIEARKDQPGFYTE